MFFVERNLASPHLEIRRHRARPFPQAAIPPRSTTLSNYPLHQAQLSHTWSDSFSGSKGEEIELEKADITTAVPQIPDIRLSASSDITDHGLRSSTRALETDAAATKAHSKAQRLHVSQNDTTDDDSDTEVTEPVKPEDESKREARRLVRTYTQAHPEILRIQHRSGTQTPALDKHLHDLEYVPPPDKYKANPATLARSLTRLLQQGYKPRTYMDDPENPITHHGDSEDHSPGYFSPRRLRSGRQSRRNSGDFSTPVSGTRTPKRPKWYDRDDPDYQSLDSTSALLHGVSSTLAAAGLPPSHARPKHARTKSSQSMIAQAVDLIKHPWQAHAITHIKKGIEDRRRTGASGDQRNHRLQKIPQEARSQLDAGRRSYPST